MHAFLTCLQVGAVAVVVLQTIGEWHLRRNTSNGPCSVPEDRPMPAAAVLAPEVLFDNDVDPHLDLAERVAERRALGWTIWIAPDGRSYIGVYHPCQEHAHA